MISEDAAGFAMDCIFRGKKPAARVLIDVIDQIGWLAKAQLGIASLMML